MTIIQSYQNINQAYEISDALLSFYVFLKSAFSMTYTVYTCINLNESVITVHL